MTDEQTIRRLLDLGAHGAVSQLGVGAQPRVDQLRAENARMRVALEAVRALPDFEPDEPYGKLVVVALAD